MPGGTRKRLKPQKHFDVVERAQRVMAEAHELFKERCSLAGKVRAPYQEAELHFGSILSVNVDQTAKRFSQGQRNAVADSFRRRPQ